MVVNLASVRFGSPLSRTHPDCLGHRLADVLPDPERCDRKCDKHSFLLSPAGTNKDHLPERPWFPPRSTARMQHCAGR
jgi:hypothetical protein